MDKKWVDLINFVSDFSFGSVWWIKDTLWKILKPDFYLKKRKKYHPALCLGGRKITSVYQTIPMLFGSHSNKSGFILDGLTSQKDKKDKEKHGYFSIRCYNVAVHNMMGQDPYLIRNRYKPMLNDNEKYEFKKYLIKKGIRFYEKQVD